MRAQPRVEVPLLKASRGRPVPAREVLGRMSRAHQEPPQTEGGECSGSALEMGSCAQGEKHSANWPSNLICSFKKLPMLAF